MPTKEKCRFVRKKLPVENRLYSITNHIHMLAFFYSPLPPYNVGYDIGFYKALIKSIQKPHYWTGGGGGMWIDVTGQSAGISTYPRFPLGDFFRANKQKANVIGWWCRQCLSPANQVAFFSVRANKFAKWKTGSTYVLSTIFFACRIVATKWRKYSYLCVTLVLAKITQIIFQPFLFVSYLRYLLFIPLQNDME